MQTRSPRHAGWPFWVSGCNRKVRKTAGMFRYSRRSAPFGFNDAFYYMGFEYRI